MLVQISLLRKFGANTFHIAVWVTCVSGQVWVPTKHTHTHGTTNTTGITQASVSSCIAINQLLPPQKKSISTTSSQLVNPKVSPPENTSFLRCQIFLLRKKEEEKKVKLHVIKLNKLIMIFRDNGVV